MEFKRRKKKKSEDETVEPTKEETAVAKHLRWNCPTKSSTMMNNKVDYFVASKAVECLLDSNWASGKKNTEIIFTDRHSVVDYLDRLLTLGFFSRVVKIKKPKGKDKGKEKEKDKTEEGESKKKKKEKKSDESKKDEEVDEEEPLTKEESETKSSSATTSTSATSTTTSEEGKKKRKVKVKLELHDDQIFLDGDEAYVWIFDPIHPKTLVMGILVVLATIAICLFPLWPDSVRGGVWYISVIAAIGIGVILFLAVFRYVLFAVVWAVSVGRHHFWLLPNLTEECGFFESFKPLYTHEHKPKTTTNETTEEKQEQQDDSALKEDDKDTGSEDKENGESWVKLTDEEVEKAKKESMMDEEQEEQITTDKQDESNDEKSVEEERSTVTSSDPIC